MEVQEEKLESNSMEAFSPKMAELKNALAVLYIRNNASGRNKFLEKWSDVAEYVFGETLIRYDYEGINNQKDFEKRAILEDEADQRRVLLKDTIFELVDKSVEAGSLQFEYVGKVIDYFGPLLSTFLYAENIIERVRPGSLAGAQAAQTEEHIEENAGDVSGASASVEPVAEEEKLSPHNIVEKVIEEEVDAEKPLSEEEKSLLSNFSEDSMDDVRPIDIGALPVEDENMPEKPAEPSAPLDPLLAEAMAIREGAIASATFGAEEDTLQDEADASVTVEDEISQSEAEPEVEISEHPITQSAEFLAKIEPSAASENVERAPEVTQVSTPVEVEQEIVSPPPEPLDAVAPISIETPVSVEPLADENIASLDEAPISQPEPEIIDKAVAQSAESLATTEHPAFAAADVPEEKEDVASQPNVMMDDGEVGSTLENLKRGLTTPVDGNASNVEPEQSSSAPQIFGGALVPKEEQPIEAVTEEPKSSKPEKGACCSVFNYVARRVL